MKPKYKEEIVEMVMDMASEPLIKKVHKMVRMFWKSERAGVDGKR